MHSLSIQKMIRRLQQGVKIYSFVAVLFSMVCRLAFAEARDPAATSVYENMTLNQRVGQIFIWTYSGESVSTEYAKFLEEFQPGGLIAFGRNIKSPHQIAAYNQALNKLSSAKLKAPFFLMIDQEGGLVTRLRTHVPLPSAMALGKMGDIQFVQKFAQASGELLREVGFNFDLAPVLDVSSAGRDGFIGNRAFGEDPDTVAEMAIAYAQGISDAGLIPTAKHFPGHGGVNQDSHQTLPKKMATYEDLTERDLVPFTEYAQGEFAKALMMAHLALPNVDSTGVPSTYSKVLIQQHLRGDLKYDGIILTDDLEMTGASLEKEIGARAVRAFLSGNDMLMVAGSGKDQRAAFQAVRAAVQSGKISETRLKESVNHILAYKAAIKAGQFSFNESNSQKATTKLDDLSRQVLNKNVKLAFDSHKSAWPVCDQQSKALVLSSDKTFFAKFQQTFQGQAEYFTLTPKTLDRATVRLANEDYDVIAYYASGAQTARWLSKTTPEQRRKIIVVNANHSAEVTEQETFLAVLNINSPYPESGAPLGEALTPPTAPLRQPTSEPEK